MTGEPGSIDANIQNAITAAFNHFAAPGGPMQAAINNGIAAAFNHFAAPGGPMRTAINNDITAAFNHFAAPGGPMQTAVRDGIADACAAPGGALAGGGVTGPNGGVVHQTLTASFNFFIAPGGTMQSAIRNAVTYGISDACAPPGAALLGGGVAGGNGGVVYHLVQKSEARTAGLARNAGCTSDDHPIVLFPNGDGQLPPVPPPLAAHPATKGQLRACTLDQLTNYLNHYAVNISGPASHDVRFRLLCHHLNIRF